MNIAFNIRNLASKCLKDAEIRKPRKTDGISSSLFQNGDFS